MKDTPQERIDVLEQGLVAAMQGETYQSYLSGIGLDRTSVTGAETWDAQIREMYATIYTTLEELGLRK